VECEQRRSLACVLITQSDALKCLDGTSIAFVGDSQLCDLAYATARFLLDGSMSRADVNAEGSAHKFSTHFRRAEPNGVIPRALESDVRATKWHVDFYDARTPDWPALCEIANGGGLHRYAYVFKPAFTTLLSTSKKHFQPLPSGMWRRY
jgi:hypothetical protein